MNRDGWNQPHGPKKGSVLVGVLAAVFLVSLFVMAVVRMLAYDLEERSVQSNRFEAFLQAEKAVWVALHPRVKRDDPLLRVGEGEKLGYQAKVTSEGGRLSINQLLRRIDKEPALQRVLVSYFADRGLDLVQAQTLLDRLLDWTDRDSERRMRGAENRDYAVIGQPAYPRNRDFLSVDEMGLVMGMEELEAVYPRWRDDFTVFGDGKLNLNEAEAVLISAATGATLAVAQNFVELRKGRDGLEGTEDDRRFTDLATVGALLGVPPSVWSSLQDEVTLEDNWIRVEAVGIAGPVRQRLVVVAERRGNRPQIKSWQLK